MTITKVPILSSIPPSGADSQPAIEQITRNKQPTEVTMTASNTGRRRWRGGLFALGLLGILGLTGCQIDVGGQTLPSPWYLNDDVQYFPPGANSRFRMKRTRRRPSRWSRRSSDKRPRKRIVPVTRGVAGTLVSTFTAACRAELPAAQLGSGDGPLCGVKPSRRGDGKLARLASMIEGLCEPIDRDVSSAGLFFSAGSFNPEPS